MAKKHSKRLIIILIIVSLVALGAAGVIFFINSKTLSERKQNSSPLPRKDTPPSPNDNPSDNSPKKDLAQKIKADLKQRIERIKNSKTKPDSSDWNPYMVFDDRISCVAPDMRFLKQKESVFPSQIGTDEYQEIVNLINQAKQAWKEWKNQRNQEAEQKLANQPDLFYNAYESAFSGEIGPFPNWGFTGKQGGQEYCLIIPKNHPIFVNFSIPQGGLYQYYRITGVENIPLVPSPMDGTGLFKIVKLSDKITITQC